MANFQTQATVPVEKMIIELNETTRKALDLRLAKEGLNATTLFNRAMQVYNRLMVAQESGERIVVGDIQLTIT
jgi:hypothetical protein